MRGFLALAFACVALFGVNVARAYAAPPVIDGNLTDMIAYAQSLQSSGAGAGLVLTDKPNASGDPTPETIYNDAKFIPCVLPQPPLGTHWVNGVEIFRHVLAYTPGSSTLYLGIRSEGFIGDADGNDNPDTDGGGSCNPNDNIVDVPGIGGNELYAWSFDLDCNGTTDATLKIQDNVLVGTGAFAAATGHFEFRKNDGVGATGRDLEVEVTLPAPLPPAFKYVRVESNAFDGLSEDRAEGATFVGTAKIDVAKSALPVNVCVGKTTRFSITVSNSGQTPLSVDLVDQLPATLSYAGGLVSDCGVGEPANNGTGQLTFPPFNLTAGQVCTISFDALAGPECFGEATNRVTATGTFRSACIKEVGGTQTVQNSAQTTVICLPLPCITIEAHGPAAACPSEKVTITGKATNCSSGPETIVVKVNGAVAYDNVVAANTTVDWRFAGMMPVDCGTVTGVTGPSFVVIGTAKNDCGEVNRETLVVVRCKDKPCVTLETGILPASACPGDQVTVSGGVANCSLDPEVVVVTINGEQVFSQSLAPNETARFTKSLPMPACTAGDNVKFVVVATATGDCLPPDSKTFTHTVLCKEKPCVAVVASAVNPAGCPNSTVVIKGKVTNCGGDPADYVVTVNGHQAFTGPLDPKGFAEFTYETTLGACVAGDNVDFVVVATASNRCGEVHEETHVLVRCIDKPCVTLKAIADVQSACPNAPIKISGEVLNCSKDPETVVVTVNGEVAFTQLLAPNASANFSKDVVMLACTPGTPVVYNVVATATGDCSPPDSKTVPVSVACKKPPCVKMVVSADKAAACPGEAVKISGKIINCGEDAADYVVTVGGNQVFSGNLAAGAEQLFSYDTAMGDCVAGANVEWAVVATAHNQCGDARDAQTVSVRCKAKPCVTLTADREPASACPGDKIILRGEAKNCSIDPETIEVTVNGVSIGSGTVSPGEVLSFNKAYEMPPCTPGQPVTYTVLAKATNDCDHVGVNSNQVVLSVDCKKPPCVELVDVISSKRTACANETITISGKVKNCGDDAATYTVLVAGHSAFTGSIAAGQTSAFTYDVSMGACVADNQVTFLVTASAVNSCGTASKETPISVLCAGKPCVELKAIGPDSSCPARQITINGKVRNCSTASETIVVTVDGVQVFNAPVAGNAEATWTTTVPMKDCLAGQVVKYHVIAGSRNDCGSDSKETDVSVLCLAPPCVAINLNAPAISCAGSLVKLCGEVTNCSAGFETIEVRYLDQTLRYEGVAPGTSKTYCFEVRMPACITGDVHEWAVTAAAINDCGRIEKTVTDETKCKLPLIKVKKAAESTVDDGGIIHYTIIVENAGEVALENVLITDTMCKYTVYNDHANPPAFAEPALGTNGVVIWRLPILNKGESLAFTFEARASIAAGGGQCPGNFVCTNRVEAVGYCAGSDNKTPVKDSDQTTTTIKCVEKCSAVTVEKSVDPSGTVEAGAKLHYTIKVCNPSTVGTLTDVKVTDNLCAALKYMGNAAPLPVTAPAVGATGPVVWNIPSIAPGGCVTITFDAVVKTVETKTCDQRTCTNTVLVEGHCADVVVRSEASVTTPILCRQEACSKVTVEKTVSPTGAVDPGTKLHYTIKVCNPSTTGTLTNVVLTDDLCRDSKYVANATDPQPFSAPASGSTGTVVWKFASIAPGTCVTVNFDAIIKTVETKDGGGDARSCTNQVEVVGYCGNLLVKDDAEVTTPINGTAANRCRVTASGCLSDDNGKHNGDGKDDDSNHHGERQSTFGGSCSSDGHSGDAWEHVVREGHKTLMKWKSFNIRVVSCSEVPGLCGPDDKDLRADLEGVGTIRVQDNEFTANAVGYVIDRVGDCKKSNRDEYGIIIRKGSVIGSGQILFQSSGKITCGDVKIDNTPGRGFGNGITPPGEIGNSGVELINRPYPNPFSSTMNFSYRVDTDNSLVEVGVYNVAGRLVRTLAGGTQPVGTYMLTWDGSDDYGVRMAPGVYFLKSRVGSASIVNRVIYVAR